MTLTILSVSGIVCGAHWSRYGFSRMKQMALEAMMAVLLALWIARYINLSVA